MAWPFKTQIQQLTQKWKIKLGFLYRIKGCLSSSNRKTIVQATFMSVLDYGDILYCHATQSTLHQLNPVYYSALHLITNDSYRTHHCSLYQKVQWLLFSQDEIFISCYSFTKLCCRNYQTTSHLFSHLKLVTTVPSPVTITLDIPHTWTNICRTGFRYYAAFTWNELQSVLKLDSLIPFGHFKAMLSNVHCDSCNCFYWLPLLCDCCYCFCV